MPNCDFYASIEDHEKILQQLFELDECDVYELQSQNDQPLKKFNDVQSVLSEFDRSYANGDKWNSVYLSLYVHGAGFNFKPIKTTFEESSGFAFRYRADQIGLIQLYLEIPKKNRLDNSHMNHCTEKRAMADLTAFSKQVAQEVKSCDFQKVTKFSAKLNRIIRKDAVGKLSSLVVLEGAHQLWQSGFELGSFGRENFEPFTK